MRGQENVYPVPNIGQFRVMFLHFSQQGNARHKGKGFRKIGEQELTDNAIARLIKIPFAQRIERDTKVPVNMSPQPLEAVVLGAGHCVENFSALRGMFMDSRR